MFDQQKRQVKRGFCGGIAPLYGILSGCQIKNTSLDPMKEPTDKHTVRYIDLFCGIGGFRIAAEQAANRLGTQAECVLSSDIDPACQSAYEENFGEKPLGDISSIDTRTVPDHDLLLAGFQAEQESS